MTIDDLYTQFRGLSQRLGELEEQRNRLEMLAAPVGVGEQARFDEVLAENRELRERVEALEGQLMNLTGTADAHDDPRREVFPARMLGAKTWQERAISEDGEWVDSPDGRKCEDDAALAALMDPEDTQFLLSIRYKDAARYVPLQANAAVLKILGFSSPSSLGGSKYWARLQKLIDGVSINATTAAVNFADLYEDADSETLLLINEFESGLSTHILAPNQYVRAVADGVTTDATPRSRYRCYVAAETVVVRISSTPGVGKYLGLLTYNNGTPSSSAALDLPNEASLITGTVEIVNLYETTGAGGAPGTVSMLATNSYHVGTFWGRNPTTGRVIIAVQSFRPITA